MPKIKQLEDIVDWRMCLGCGACAYICPEDKIVLENVFDEGIRPKRTDKNCHGCNLCVDVCPAVQTDFGQFFGDRQPRPFEKDWGAISGIWEGYATDEEIRFKGSSGGALTALALYCLEQEAMEGVLHIGQDEGNALLNSTRLSRSREDLMKTTGSRYSPASVCDRLDLVEHAAAPCAVIGKPAEISAVQNARRLRPALDAKIGVTMSFFCAETPPTKATVELMKNFNVDPDSVADLRYRGYGWPGYFTTTTKNEPSKEHWIYQKSWAYLQKFRPWSIQMWPDGSGELADITCGDPWYEEPDGKNPGFSLIVTRTDRGRELVEAAIAAGYLTARPAEEWKLQKSQEGLLAKKGSVWGRRVASRLMGIPIADLKGNSLFHCWKQLSFRAKVISLAGTIRRVVQRNYYRRQARATGQTTSEQ